MNCQRCNALPGSEAVIRIYSDIIDVKVCAQCAREASDLGLAMEPLDSGSIAMQDKTVRVAA